MKIELLLKEQYENRQRSSAQILFVGLKIIEWFSTDTL